MDDYTTAEIMAAAAAAAPDGASPAATLTPSPSHKPGLMGTLREKAGFQDRLVERLLQQVMPSDDGPAGGAAFAQRPGFNLSTMSYNFRHFNARIGVVFRFQADVERLLAWRRPARTLSLLAVYSFVCLDPYLLPALPMVLLLLAVLAPAFVARHPAPPRGTLSSEQAVGYSPRGPLLAPAATVRPARELSSDFFRNMRDLQNGMADFSHAHDKVVDLVVPLTNFSDEALSSTLFLVPWRFLFLAAGWALVAADHPAVKALVRAQHRQHLRPREQSARSWLDAWVAADVILDEAPETREVEIFELQRREAEWEPWLFTPSPYEPLSPARINGERPRGTRFFEDVLPPPGWEWSEKKWALDLWSREWVEERIITGVEVETEGERWVYDMHDDREHRTGVVDAPHTAAVSSAAGSPRPKKPPQRPSWQEGDDGGGLRGEWRRRWVRLVKRRAAPQPAGA